ncbi:lecithin retinol acyltransferase family protein [Variovorax sp. LjRoot130]|uniref:lecithin retinol acyltransferase family protein n=1 Tax=Variovorax sp. LjRoot130 TaxID=3342261 RepID=UPI003ECCC5AC
MTPDGIEVTSLSEFAQGLPVRQDKAAPIERHSQIEWFASQSAGAKPPYDLVKLNCEHYATWLTGEKPMSQQVGAVGIIALLVAAALLSQ